MGIQQIRLHGPYDHLPGGPDALPWLGEYPFGNTATSLQGIHMVGVTANMPTPSLGTQSGSDGAVTGTAFTSASGRFTTHDTGDTVTITDIGASPPVVYQFTVTYVSGTALTLSGSWAGTGSSSLPWVLSGRGPSNAGLGYLATDTSEWNVSDGTAWHSVGGGGGGSGFQFNSGTYGADNVGDYSIIETDTLIGVPFTNAHSLGGGDNVEFYSFAFNTSKGILFTCDPQTSFNTGNPVVNIEDWITSGGYGALGLYVTAIDTTATAGGGDVQAASFTGESSGGVAQAINAVTTVTGGSSDATTLLLDAFNSGSGKAYAINSTRGLVRLQNLPTSSAGLLAGTLWNNLGIVNIV